jgi:hypothetical protein
VLANDVLDGFAAAGEEGMAFLFTWLRMSSNKILTWARRANYQSKVGVIRGSVCVWGGDLAFFEFKV